MLDFTQEGLVHFVQFLGYPGIFLIIFAESGLFFGFFLPGASMLFTAGLLASHGVFDVRILAPLVATAAILGDSVGYWFGSYVGPRLFARKDSRFFKQEYVERTRHFYEQYGAPTVFLGRFIPIVRTFAPILAGVAGMSYTKFLTYNVLGGFIWGSGVVLAGYYLGETVPWISEYITVVVLGIIAVTTLPLAWKIFKRPSSPNVAP